MADERRLFVWTEGEGEPEHLLQTARTRWVTALFVRDSCAQRLDQAGSGRTRRVSAEHEPRRARARDGIEVDHREDVLASARLGREMRRAAGAFGGTVCREEHERVRQRDALRSCGRCVRARELDERGGPRRVVIQPAVRPGAVPVRHDHDLRWRDSYPRLLGDEVDQRRALAVDRGHEPLAADVEAVRLELPAEPGGGTLGARRAGCPIRIARGEIRCERGGSRRVEGRRQVRRLERRRLGNTEREQ